MITVNELYYPVEVNVSVKAPTSGQFKYDHFDKYGDRKGECDWTENTFGTNVRDNLRIAIADQAVGTQTAWSFGSTTSRLGLNLGTAAYSGNNSAHATVASPTFAQTLTAGGDFSDGGITWSGRATNFSGGMTEQGTYGTTGLPPRVLLYLGNANTNVAYTDVDPINLVVNGDSFDLSYTISFTFSNWFSNRTSGTSGFFSSIGGGSTGLLGNQYLTIGNGLAGLADKHALSSGPPTHTGVGTASHVLTARTNGTLLSSANATVEGTPFTEGAVNAWNFAGIGGSASTINGAAAGIGAPWFKSSEANALKEKANKRLQVTVNWTVT